MNSSIKQTILHTATSILLILGTAITPVHATPIEGKAGVKTTLKNSALVTRSEINADCLIKSDCSETIRGELAGIQLGHIPDPLGELVIEEKELREKLGKYASGLNLPKQVVIKRQGAILKGSEVENKIRSLCNSESDKNIKIDVSRVPTNIVLPGNLIEWQLTPNSDSKLGMRLFFLTARTDGGNFRQLIQVPVAKVIEAAQLTRLAKPGELISQEMVSKKVIEITSEQANMPLTYADVVGKCLGRFKSPGTILRSSDISSGENNMCSAQYKKAKQSSNTTPARRSNDRSNWVIKPGEKVEYRFANGTLELTFPARAVEGGEIGDSISLINLKNQKRVEGIIADKGLVEYAKK